MASKTRSTVFAIKEESTEGTLASPSAATDFTVLRDGSSMTPGLETVNSDELVNDIGASEPFTTKETPTGSIPKYFKHSGTEGQAPDYGLMVKSAMGSVTANSTEYDTVAGSAAGTSSTRGKVVVDTGEGANYAKGQALLIKDGTNGYKIRNVYDISGDELSLNYNLNAAPAAGIGLGKAIHYSPASSGHPTFSAHMWQSSSGSDFYTAIAGCRTTNMTMNFPANDLASVTFDFEGIKFYYNPIIVDATNNKLDFNEDSATTITATLTEKSYQSPVELAREIETKMNALATANITCSYDSTTGKFTLSSDGATFELEWSTGANAATSIGADLGFSVAADDTGATSYTADNALSYDPAFTPTFDDQGPRVVKGLELLIGDYYRTDLRKGSNISVTVATPKTDVNDFSSESGVSGSVVLSREVTMSGTLVFTEHDVDAFDKFMNNTGTAVMLNHGTKSGGNWVPGTCVNCYFPNAKITAHTLSDSDGLYVVEIEARGYVTSDQKDFHLNYV